MKATSARDFCSTIGVNTHVGNGVIAKPYADVVGVIDAVNYLGVRLVRDGSFEPSLLRLLVSATNTKMIGFIGEVPPADFPRELGDLLAYIPRARLAALEGANEPDAAYSLSVGSSPQAAAAFQPLLHRAARSVGVPSIANSFGNIWPDPGSYGTTGDLSACADLANAHVYFNPHQCGPNGSGFNSDGIVDWLHRAAGLTAPGKPVANTEFGWQHDHNTEAAIAAYVLTFLFSAQSQWGSPFSVAYGLFDDGSGRWGLFDDNGTPRLVAKALKTLFRLLDEPVGMSAPPDLDVKISGLPAGENPNAGGHAALYRRANGAPVLALWNEQRLTTDDGSGNKPIMVAPLPVTITLPAKALITVFDPLVGPGVQQKFTGVSSATISVPAHPILCEIVAA